MSASQRARLQLGDRPFGADLRPLVIAELSGNHHGQIERALALMEAAAKAGADAIKIQTYTAETITLDYDGPGFTIEGGPWHGRKLHDLYREAHTPWEWHETLFAKGRELDIPVFSTPFDFTAVGFLEKLGAPAYKIASFECVDLPLIKRCASTGKPLIISTGLASLSEIGEAVEAARFGGARDLVLLHCVSAYPAPAREYNLRRIPDLGERFGVAVGLSDHTLGSATAVAAACIGACAIEKHITLARADGGPDAGFSLEPSEFAQLVRDVRDGWEAMGQAVYERQESEKSNAQFRRSLYAVADIGKGETFTADNIRSIRPGFGLAPKHYEAVLGRRATRDIRRGTPIEWSLVSPAQKS